jgi:hypothetical protein
MNKNAITTLLFGDKKYIIGAVINAYLHKQFINKYNLKIDITVMLDKNFIEYKDELSLYYDKIFMIDLDETKISSKTDLRRYTSVMKYLPNKALMFNLTEYDKVLFTDIDFLPIKKEFYTIFDLDTPAVYSEEVYCNKFNQIYNNNFFIDKKVNQKSIDNKEYNKIIRNMKKSINASLMLVKPSDKDYKDFLLFKKSVEGVDGVETIKGVDEILILGFMILIKKAKIHCIPRSFRNKMKHINNTSLAINYACSIKPWLKLPMFQWDAENIWHVIAKKALKKSIIFTNLYTSEILETFRELTKKYMSGEEIRNSIIFETQGKKQLLELMKYLMDHKTLDVEKDSSIIKYIMSEAQQIHSHIFKELNDNYSEIIKIIQ